MSLRVVHGDCLDVLAAMDAESVHAVVCDPPYAIGFMGKEWDRIGDVGRGAHARSERADEVTPAGAAHATSAGPYLAAGVDSLRSVGRPFRAWCEAWSREAFRVLKPGGYLLAFGGTRTYHRLTSGVEDAGFEIRDTIAWMYGSGFPKSLDVSKAIDAAAGAEREVVQTIPDRWAGKGDVLQRATQTERAEAHLTAPATPEAEQWSGWGTALKPMHEPVVVARKPLTGTVAANVLAHGTGGLNVDGCRIGSGEGGGRDGEASAGRRYAQNGGTNFAPTPGPRGGDASGRWPPNVVMDEDAAAMLDEQTGTSRSRVGEARTGRNGDGWGMTATGAEYDDEGGASRFLYVAKADTDERNAGLGGHKTGASLFSPYPCACDKVAGSDAADRATSRESSPPSSSDAPTACPDCGGVIGGAWTNTHPLGPTVKPVDLMRWLVRLVTPPSGLVVDPFCGSGTTGIACALEGFDFLGIEQDADSVNIARARIAHWSGREVAR